MNKFFKNLKQQAEENPLVAISVASAAVLAISRLMQASNTRTNSKAWTKEVERRDRKSREN